MRPQGRRLAVALSGTLFCWSIGACGGGKAKNQQVQAAADSLAIQHDSSMKQMDSGRAPVVDTSKLGAAKTESVLTAQRKKP